MSTAAAAHVSSIFFLTAVLVVPIRTLASTYSLYGLHPTYVRLEISNMRGTPAVVIATQSFSMIYNNHTNIKHTLGNSISCCVPPREPDSHVIAVCSHARTLSLAIPAWSAFRLQLSFARSHSTLWHVCNSHTSSRPCCSSRWDKSRMVHSSFADGVQGSGHFQGVTAYVPFCNVNIQNYEWCAVGDKICLYAKQHNRRA